VLWVFKDESRLQEKKQRAVVRLDTSHLMQSQCEAESVFLVPQTQKKVKEFLGISVGKEGSIVNLLVATTFQSHPTHQTTQWQSQNALATMRPPIAPQRNTKRASPSDLRTCPTAPIAARVRTHRAAHLS
jgi:hypothetical protein